MKIANKFNLSATEAQQLCDSVKVEGDDELHSTQFRKTELLYLAQVMLDFQS